MIPTGNIRKCPDCGGMEDKQRYKLSVSATGIRSTDQKNKVTTNFVFFSKHNTAIIGKEASLTLCPDPKPAFRSPPAQTTTTSRIFSFHPRFAPLPPMAVTQRFHAIWISSLNPSAPHRQHGAAGMSSLRSAYPPSSLLARTALAKVLPWRWLSASTSRRRPATLHPFPPTASRPRPFQQRREDRRRYQQPLLQLSLQFRGFTLKLQFDPTHA